jgi:hypothetical protein
LLEQTRLREGRLRGRSNLVGSSRPVKLFSHFRVSRFTGLLSREGPSFVVLGIRTAGVALALGEDRALSRRGPSGKGPTSHSLSPKGPSGLAFQGRGMFGSGERLSRRLRPVGQVDFAFCLRRLRLEPTEELSLYRCAAGRNLDGQQQREIRCRAARSNRRLLVGQVDFFRSPTRPLRPAAARKRGDGRRDAASSARCPQGVPREVPNQTRALRAHVFLDGKPCSGNKSSPGGRCILSTGYPHKAE